MYLSVDWRLLSDSRADSSPSILGEITKRRTTWLDKPALSPLAQTTQDVEYQILYSTQPSVKAKLSNCPFYVCHTELKSRAEAAKPELSGDGGITPVISFQNILFPS